MKTLGAYLPPVTRYETQTAKKPGIFGSHRAMLLALALLPAFSESVLPDEERSRPGISWMEFRFPNDPAPREDSNPTLEGAIEQGFELLRWGHPTRLSVFARLDYQVDNEKIDHNNQVKPAGGARIRHILSEQSLLNIGAKYEYDYRWESDQSLDGIIYFADAFGSWQLGSGASESGRTYPGWSWTEMRYPASHDPQEEDDFILDGSLQQGVDWMRLGSKAVLNTFAGLDYTIDSEELEWNNRLTPSVGARIRMGLTRQSLLECGVEYEWEHYWKTGDTDEGPIVFLKWIAWWDYSVTRADAL